MTLPAPQPWERQPGESAKAFQAFATYRDLGMGRSLVAAATALGKSRALMSDWSIAHSWVARVDAWEREQDRVAREAQSEEIRRMRERHAQQSQAGQRMAMTTVASVLQVIDDERRANDGRSPILEALLREAPAEAVELALSGIAKLPALQQAERLARGEPTEIVAAAVVDLTPPSIVEVAAVWEALARSGLVSGPEPDEGEE